MKKKTIMLSYIAACTIVSGYIGIKTYQSHVYENNDLFMESVEALSTCESSDGYPMGSYCMDCKGHYCYYGDFVASNCISNIV